MATIDVRAQGGGPLLPSSSQPRRTLQTETDASPYMALDGRGTAANVTARTSILSTWLTRQQQWHMAFEQKVARKIREYWDIWRNFDTGPQPGPGQEWRDRTVMPQAYKELDTVVPKLLLGSWGQPENYTINGRGYRDEEYEEQIRVLLDTALDEIGKGDPQGEIFLKRIFDGTLYGQIMGHVWWKPFWRHETRWMKTKTPRLNDEGKRIGWDPIEQLETIVDGVDLYWIPISRLAIDVYGKRRWAIERIDTTLEALEEENKRYREETGQELYPQQGLFDLKLGSLGSGVSAETEEPRDTEHWPLDDNGLYSQDPGSHRVELWLAWDNIHGTLTKIANRRVVLDHGLANTPDGLDPYIGVPAVPVPGRPYGDSIFNWNDSLYRRQTRLVRARMDETLMNLFQQYLVREGLIGNTTWFFRPGGMQQVQNLPIEQKLSDSIYLIPRRPVPAEAYNEEAHAQSQSETVTGADVISQGGQATQKSRDVTAAETNQRVMQGSVRMQMKILYYEACFKKPLMQAIFDLMRQNMTQPKIIRILDDTEGKALDLTSIQRPVDIVVGGTLTDQTQAETMAEIEKVTNLLKDPNFAIAAKHQAILQKFFEATRTLRKNAKRYVKTEEEMEREAQERQQAEQQAALAAAGASPDAKGPPQAAVPQGAAAPGGAGAVGLSGGNGSGPIDPGSAARNATVEI